MKQKMNNLPVSRRLLITFVIILAMFCVTIVLSILGLFSTGDNFDSFYEGPYEITNKAANLKNDIEKVSKYIGYSMMEEDEKVTAEYIQDAKDALQSLREGTAFLQEYLEDKAILSQYDTIMKSLMEDRDKVLELAGQNQNQEAIELYFNNVMPGFEQATELLTRINESADEEADANHSTAVYQKNIVTVLLMSIAVLTFAITIFLARYIIVSITKPITEIEEAAREMAAGSLNVALNYESRDEMGSLASSMRLLIGRMKEIIGDIGKILASLAEGDFHVRSDCRENYVKDYAPILDSMRLIRDNLNSTMLEISEASKQVAAGSDQMAQNAQGLAEGATDQAGAVEELTATVENVANMAESSAADVHEAYEHVKEASEKAEISKKDMEELRLAMDRISETSKQIGNIIADIEDIASQTNLLSLNASIEAARAGEAGRGFAVVADQIGKLASDSAQSAVNTRELIGKSLEEIAVGNTISMKTAEAFEQVISEMKNFAEIAKNTSETSTTQYESLKQVQNGIEQISSVVQSNSAAAEETSATSEELSAQAVNLESQVNKFKLI